METLPYLLVSVAITVSSVIGVVRITWAHPRIELKLASLIVGGAVIWLLMSALEVTSSDISTKLFFNKISFVGHIGIIPTTWLILSMLISGYQRYVRRKTIIALSIVPLITLLLIFTNEYHGLIWNSVRLDAADPILPLNITYGLGYWLLVVGYSYAVLLVGSILFAWRMILSRRLYRLQALVLMPVLLVPWALDMIYQYNRNLFGYVEPTAVTLAPAAAILMWRLIYLPALDVVPVAHEMIIDNLSEAIIVLDWERRVVDLNPSAQALLGHTLQEVAGRPVENVWTEWPSVRKALDARAEGPKEVSFGIGNRLQVYELQDTALARVGREDAVSTLIILRDITERKSMDEKLRLYSEHLEELVKERTKELRDAERMAAIGETAAMVGHDLRNPLQGITSATYVLKKDLHSTMNERAREMIAIIEESVKHSDRIVSDLLEYSREPKLKLEEADLNQLVKEAVASVRIPENTQAKLRVSEMSIAADCALMRRVFVNIITNAVDAMPNGGELAIESKESNGSLEISFTDTGTGFSDEAMKKLWKPLNTTKAKGSGLGLAICRKIVEAHKGSISMKTAHGKGTTLTITLPIKQEVRVAG